MEQRVSLITLAVADLDRAGAFYESLGWRRSVRQAQGVVFFQLGAVALALYPRRDLAADARLSPAGEGFQGVALAYNARTREEVDCVLAEAQAAGARISNPARDTAWGGYVGYFTDLDDHLWEVAWNPGFRIEKDGSIVLPD
jgi:predicted lactoylglutathione lyase